MNVNPETSKARAEHGRRTYYFCCGGCAQKFQQDPEKYLSASAPMKTMPAAMPLAAGAKPAVAGLAVLGEGPKEKDPVCGMMVDPRRPAGKVEHAGKTYFLCSQRCAERFLKEPEKFLAAPGTVGMELAPPSKATDSPGKNMRYTCPMDPEIIQIGPGTCPKCGMALEPMDMVAEEQPDHEYDSMRMRFWVSATLSLPILILSMFGEALGLRLETSLKNAIEFLLATPVVLWCGWPFYQRFWNSLVNRSPNMFTLIGLGTGAAYIYSVAATLFPQFFPASFRDMHGGVAVYFEAAAVITTLVMLGQVLELRARHRTSSAIR
jgi:Cu+-exporting ATPase